MVIAETPYLVMEYVEAEGLDRLIEARPEPGRAIDAVIQLLSGLHCIHEAGIVHRDVKPENVLVLQDETVRLADFGVARIGDLEATTAAIIGTPFYMSPEQIAGRAPDRRGDIFSCGVVLYELLTGQKPFAAESFEELSERIAARDRQKADALVPGLPQGIEQVIALALEPEPDARFQTARAFAEALADAFGPAAKAHQPTIIEPLSAEAQAEAEAGAQAEAEAPAPGPASPHSPVPEADRRRIEEALTREIGPAAHSIVEQGAASAADTDSLVEHLCRWLGDPARAARFRAAVEASGPLPGELKDALARLLVVHIGPIAPMLVKKCAKAANSDHELVETLAGHIADDKARAKFLKDAADLWER